MTAPDPLALLWALWYRVVLALCMWREARGEGAEGMRAVGHVIRNRVLKGWGDWDHVVTKKWQFSSFTAPGDPELVLWPDSPDEAFEQALSLADSIFSGADSDPTSGALFYCNLSVAHPAWADQMRKTCVIGHHTFFA